MFSKIGTPEILVVLVIALVVFGPSKLPQLGRALGDTLRNFKEGSATKSETEDKKEDKH